MPTITFTGDEIATLAAFAAQVNSSLYPAPGDVEAAARIPNTHFTRLKSIIDKLEAGIEAATDAAAARVANTIYAGPSAGPDAAATFRALAAPDIPTITSTKISDFTDAAAAAAPVQSVAGRGGAVVLAIADVAGLQTALDGKSATGHGHSIGDVTGLQTALDGKSAVGHAHAAADVTSGVFGVARGGTGLSNIASGKILFASALDTLAELSVGTGLQITGTTLNCTVSGGGIDGSGTATRLAKWTDTDTLAAGLLADDGANVTLVSGQLLVPDGSAAAPSLGFSAEATGFYRSGGSEMSVCFAGARYYIWNGSTLRPANDEALDIGSNARRFTYVYAANHVVHRSIQGASSKVVTDNTVTSFVRVSAPTTDSVVGGKISYTIEAVDATNHIVQAATGILPFVLANENGTVTATLGTVASTAYDTAGGTLTASETAFTAVPSGTNVDFKIQFNYDQAVLTGTVTARIRYLVTLDGQVNDTGSGVTPL